MKIKCFWEHNDEGTLLYATEYPGAFTRGPSLEIAKRKMPQEIRSFLRWQGKECRENDFNVVVAEEKFSDLQIRDADSDALFDNEKLSMTKEEYRTLKKIALKSAADFHRLYASFPNKDVSSLPQRKTFYGAVPRTAREMYEHTKNVNSYYFGEIGVICDNTGDILHCRQRGFALLEKQPLFWENKLFVGSYDEQWTLKKVLRRFVWHDRIHAKAMFRMALNLFGKDSVPNVFCFEEV